MKLREITERRSDLSIDGTWPFTVNSPRGEQAFSATFATDGERLSGTMTGAQANVVSRTAPS
ncbi:hypothetical protein HCN51_55180 [Nonomuraea sp. FMUSA5-5]|uniref:Uncharacterized protein n=1 Tax=Nonomuraea composti TaxID=2720023 RepID=A0ABX1BUS8_9ACTN|nr:hypothetical protein [Nonomuraea sp. FMUSA5-5]NJP98473.1 hypothetical protein [Nonomuraea sp. FMUSA5-5]